MGETLHKITLVKKSLLLMQKAFRDTYKYRHEFQMLKHTARKRIKAVVRTLGNTTFPHMGGGGTSIPRLTLVTT